jgi:hypothetical protein
MGDAKKPDAERLRMVTVYSLRLSEELTDRLTRWRKGQPVEPGFTATVVRALDLFLAKQEASRTSYQAPAWPPVCPKCGGEAYWLNTRDLVVTCPGCRTWDYGAYPEQEGHELLARRWGGPKAGAEGG